MSSLNEFHKTAVATANELRAKQAVTDAERTANDGKASKPTRMEEKAAQITYNNAMRQFQNALDALDTFPTNLAEMYAEIGEVRL